MVAVVVVVAGQESYIDFMRFPDLRNQLGRWDIRTMLTAKKQKNKLCLLCFKRWELNGTNNTSVSKKCPKRSYPAHNFFGTCAWTVSDLPGLFHVVPAHCRSMIAWFTVHFTGFYHI